MTVLDQGRRQAVAGASAGATTTRRESRALARQPVNVGQAERAVSLLAGSILAVSGLSRGTLPGLLAAGIGGALLHRGYTGRCRAYSALGIDTDQAIEAEEISSRGIHIEQSYLVGRPAEELYRYWRNFENLPRIMRYLERVDAIDDRRSHWVARAPRLAGGQVEWDAEITRDEPNAAIAWRSLPGADMDHAGHIRFVPAPGDRGTEVHVSMDYLPPAGRLGDWAARLFGKAPGQEIREDLRSFKRAMETGEIPTIEGQPRGTCTGTGKREGE